MMWMGGLIRALAPICVLLVGAGADAAESDSGTDRPVVLYGKQIPLPAGNWQRVGSALTATDDAGHPVPGPVMSVVLFRVEQGTVTAFVTIHTNLRPAQQGWGAAAACRRTDLYAATPGVDHGGDVSCSFAAPVFAVTPAAPNHPPSSPAWGLALAEAREHGWSLPETWLMAGARVGDREDFIDIRYHFNPRSLSPSNTGALSAPPSRAVLIERLVQWRLIMAAAVDAGFKNRLAAGFVLPWPDGTANGAALESHDREQALADLLAQGRLTPAQYQEQVHLVTTPNPDPLGDVNALWMVAAKTVGWRVVVAASVAVLSYAFTGSALVAGGITGVSTLVNGGLYFGHELLWKTFDPYTENTDPIIDFPAVGLTG
jgi:uncharacterized membrane protein